MPDKPEVPNSLPWHLLRQEEGGGGLVEVRVGQTWGLCPDPQLLWVIKIWKENDKYIYIVNDLREFMVAREDNEPVIQ